MYFLAMHTEMDCMVKRSKRGYLFMTGDEDPYPILSRHVVEAVVGDRMDEDVACEEIVAELQKSYVPFFLIPTQERAERCERSWRNLIGDNVLVLDSAVDVCYVAAGALLLSEGRVSTLKELAGLLTGAGMPAKRQAAVVRALTPYAEVVFKQPK
jgi:hypothetical protein